MKNQSRTARFVAIEILCTWEERGLPLDQILEDHLAGVTLPDPRDRPLIMSMVYGVVRWRGYLDWLLGKFSKHPLAKIKTRTLQALRLGAFQLLFLDRVPASAAIYETVRALKEMKQPKWVTGYVNGILRSIDRERLDIPGPQVAGKSAGLPEGALLSHPEWLIRRWKNRYGSAAAAAICRQNNRVAPLCLRVNTALTTPSALLEKLKSAGLQAAAGNFSPLAIKLESQGAITAIPGFAGGLFQVQDEAAQLVSMLLGPLMPGRLYLDGCAGLGGKTSHLAQMLAAGSTLVAIEPNTARLRKLKENLTRLQLDKRVTIVQGSLDAFLPGNRETFAGVLIDAPCSGLGVIRHHPDIRWQRTPEDLLRYQEKQLNLLKDAAQLVALQGVLVYVTCSTEPEENDEVVQKFLAEHPQFVLSGCRDLLPDSAAPFVDSRGFFRTLPDRDDLAGFFAARLVKTNI